MLSFGKLSNALVVMVITGIQFIHVFLLTVKEKKIPKCWDTWHFETRYVLLDVVWKSYKRGGRSKKFSLR